jgi:hypothetical protein
MQSLVVWLLWWLLWCVVCCCWVGHQNGSIISAFVWDIIKLVHAMVRQSVIWGVTSSLTPLEIGLTRVIIAIIVGVGHSHGMSNERARCDVGFVLKKATCAQITWNFVIRKHFTNFSYNWVTPKQGLDGQTEHVSGMLHEAKCMAQSVCHANTVLSAHLSMTRC